MTPDDCPPHQVAPVMTPVDCPPHQVAPGPEMLTTPEPRFYVLGSKSYGRSSSLLQTDLAWVCMHVLTTAPSLPHRYGRSSSFLLTIGHKQVQAVVGMLSAEMGDRLRPKPAPGAAPGAVPPTPPPAP